MPCLRSERRDGQWWHLCHWVDELGHRQVGAFPEGELEEVHEIERGPPMRVRLF